MCAVADLGSAEGADAPPPIPPLEIGNTKSSLWYNNTHQFIHEVSFLSLQCMLHPPHPGLISMLNWLAPPINLVFSYWYMYL